MKIERSAFSRFEADGRGGARRAGAGDGRRNNLAERAKSHGGGKGDGRGSWTKSKVRREFLAVLKRQSEARRFNPFSKHGGDHRDRVTAPEFGKMVIESEPCEKFA